ncbi:hypothetical protein HO133_001867 [Letharia lupina]|uniref:Uncharacterized protein n=1 Tax=Letharia lupina TaxID=560253 RepID=A0A8H6FBN4_9LECA|nr:uncharacterized protein HO133_001867 [Letharia lupina]KAF6221899.1 hypothetical protein HO133_001867 [Letharia lupina]
MAVIRIPIITMLLPTIVCLFVATAYSINITTSNVLTPTFPSNTSSSAILTHAFASNTTIFAPLTAPIYRNVTPGDVWVFPSSANDLGARQASIADTEKLTTCNIKSSVTGCCPRGEVCAIPDGAICYDHTSSNCSNRASPPPNCCPAHNPFCRDFKPRGWGCYGVSTTASSTSTVPTMTAAGTSNIFAPPASTSPSAISTHTMTISVVSDGHGGVSLDFPTKSAAAGSEGGETTYVLDWPASSATPIAAGTSGQPVESTSNTVLSAAVATSTASSTTAQSTSASSSTIPPRSSSPPALCYNPDANSHPPCPTTATPPASSSTSGAGFNPSGATIVRSQASKLRIPLLHPLDDDNDHQSQRGNTVFLFLPLLAASILYVTFGHFVKRSDANRAQLGSALRALGYDDPQIDAILAGPRTGVAEPGTAEKKDITVVRGSARPLLAPRVVSKGQIRVVRGSARPFVLGKRAHSLWEGMRGAGDKEDGGEERVEGDGSVGKGEEA